MQRFIISLLLFIVVSYNYNAEIHFAHRRSNPRLPASSYEFPLDAITNFPHSAYSVTRKLKASWSNLAFKAANTAGTTQDIGFVNNLIDTNTIMTLAGSTNDVYVIMLFDQTGNNNHLTLAPVTNTARYVIATNGVLLVDDNNYPRAKSREIIDSFIAYDGTVGSTYEDITGTNTTYYYIFSAYLHATTLSFLNLGNSLGMDFRQAGPASVGLGSVGGSYTNGAYSLNQQYLAQVICNSASTDSIRLNNSAASTGDGGSNPEGGMVVGGNTGGNSARQYFSELYVFTNIVVSATTDGILTNNINTFYTLW